MANQGTPKISRPKVESKTSERRLEQTERHQRALELRRTGLGFEEIAAQLGYRSTSGAYDAVMTGLRKALREPADEVRTLELSRLDRLQLAIWPRAIEGDLDTIDRVLKIMAKRAELLGLDAPQKVAATVNGSSSIQFYIPDNGRDPSPPTSERPSGSLAD